MIDANTELHRLRQSLRFKNLSESVIDSICDDISNEISNILVDLLANAMSEAVRVGSSADFIQEVMSVRNGSSFNISTQSGKSDFSEAPFPMLPKLLQNAKVSKDGTLYKVIPVKQKSSISKTAVTTEAALANIENARMQAKRDKVNENRGSSSPDIMRGADTLSAVQSISNSRKKTNKYESSDGPIQFRTATSKQDANTQWVNPGKQANMTGLLQNINANLQDEIDRVILETIKRYEGEY